LRDGVYHPIRPRNGRLPSQVLKLHLEGVGHVLRFWNPQTQAYLPTPAETLQQATEAQQQAEEQAAQAAEAQQQAEQQAAQAIEAQHQAEQQAAHLAEMLQAAQQALEALQQQVAQMEQQQENDET